MPSFLDMLQSSSAGDEPGGDAPLDVLASVKTEGGRRRRRRHRRNAALSGLALALVAVPAFALVGGGDDPQRVESTDLAGADHDSSREPDAEPAPESGAGVPQSTTTTAPPTEVAGVVITRPEAPPETVPPTTAPPLVCHNSTDERCGGFYWDPQPGANQPLTLSTSVLDLGGGQYRIDVVWTDPDAPTLTGTDDDTDGVMIGVGCNPVERNRFGPWTPPAAAAGSGSFSITYTSPGDGQPHSVSIYAATLTDCGYDPYGSEAQTTVTIP